MADCKPATTPMQVNCKLSKPDRADIREMDKYPYQNLIGALLHLLVTTRPDITFAVNYLSQFNSNFNNEHWKAAKIILRYLKHTSDFGLMYEKNDLNLFGVVDVDWSSDVVDRKSYSGFAFILAGSPISWEARKQKSVALSSTEAKYVAISEATKEAMYLRGILSNLYTGDECTILFNDN